MARSHHQTPNEAKRGEPRRSQAVKEPRKSHSNARKKPVPTLEAQRKRRDERRTEFTPSTLNSLVYRMKPSKVLGKRRKPGSEYPKSTSFTKTSHFGIFLVTINRSNRKSPSRD